MSALLAEQPLVELLADRSGPLAAESEVLLRAGALLLLRVVLDAVEAEDQIDRLLSDRRGRQRLVKVAPQVRVTGRALAPRDLRDDVVAAVPVDDQVPPRSRFGVSPLRPPAKT
jgi:hypothetical protein